MICPYLINASLLLGAVLSWGIMWPLVEKKKGDWYSARLPPSSLNGLQGYRVKSDNPSSFVVNFDQILLMFLTFIHAILIDLHCYVYDSR